MNKLLQLASIFICLGTFHTANAMKISGKLSSDGIYIISMKGSIDTGDARTFKNQLWWSEGKPVLVELDSSGGYVVDGHELIDTINYESDMMIYRDQLMAVHVKGMCASMCIPVFYAFQSRFASTSARFGFHGASRNGYHAGPETLEYFFHIQGVTYYREDHGTADFLEEIYEHLQTTDLTWFSGKKLASKKAFIHPNRVMSLDELKAKYKKGKEFTVTRETSFKNHDCPKKISVITKDSVVKLIGEGTEADTLRVMVTIADPQLNSHAASFCTGDVKKNYLK